MFHKVDFFILTGEGAFIIHTHTHTTQYINVVTSNLSRVHIVFKLWILYIIVNKHTNKAKMFRSLRLKTFYQ